MTCGLASISEDLADGDHVLEAKADGWTIIAAALLEVGALQILEEAIADHGVDLQVLQSVVNVASIFTDVLELLEEAIADHGVDLQVLEVVVVNGDWA